MSVVRAPDPTRQPFGQFDWGLAAVVAGLKQARARWRLDRERAEGVLDLPSIEVLGQVVSHLKAALFPLRLGPAGLREESEDYFVGHTVDAALNLLLSQIRRELDYCGKRGSNSGQESEPQGEAIRIAREFAAGLPAVRALLDSDVVAAYRGDPAAHSVDEVLLCYPGVLAMIHHRLAHMLYRLGVPLLARMIAEIAHSATGIDIHPGAQIGESFFIDHGTGVVIGETAVIGKRVRLYQAVTLGAKRFLEQEDGALVKGVARHPIIEDDVVIYAGATVLGRITIGAGSIIGGNVWLTHSVPPRCVISQARASEELFDAGAGI